MILLADIAENLKHHWVGKALEWARLHHCLNPQSRNKNKVEVFKVVTKNLVGLREFLFLKKALESNTVRKVLKDDNIKLREVIVGILLKSKYHGLKQQF